MTTDWLQNGYGMVTEWLQNGYRLVTEWLQSGSRMVPRLPRAIMNYVYNLKFDTVVNMRI